MRVANDSHYTIPDFGDGFLASLKHIGRSLQCIEKKEQKEAL
jgi:hypothetical protein